MVYMEFNIYQKLLAVSLTIVLAGGLFCGGTTHEPIRIDNTQGLTKENGLRGGSGTEENPYLIKNWEIDASDSDYGLLLKDIEAHILINNVKISGAEIANLSLKNVSNAAIKRCQLTDSENGLEIIAGKHTVISSNRVTSNKFGISIVNGSRATVEHNLVKSNKFGIYLESTELNQIAYNQIEENSWNGIYIDSTSRTNTFHHNNFIGNQVAPVRAENRLNNWNGKEAGNYWSDYSGKDSNGDGMGEHAYKIPSSHTKVYDYKPFMKPVPDTYGGS
mgnify:CR=1 FL=1